MSTCADRKVLLKALRNAGASTVSIKKLRLTDEMSDWASERIVEAIRSLEGEKILAPMGSSSTRFAVDEEALKNASLEMPTAEEPAPDPEPAPAQAAAVAESEATTAESDQAPAPAAEPATRKSKLAYLMSKIQAVKAPEILTGAAREERINALFEQCVDKVVEVNSAIVEIAAKFPFWVDPEKDLLKIERINPEPESSAPGGVRLSYFPKMRGGVRRERLLIEEPWPQTLTSCGGGYVVKKIEREAVSLVERMTNFVLRQK